MGHEEDKTPTLLQRTCSSDGPADTEPVFGFSLVNSNEEVKPLLNTWSGHVGCLCENGAVVWDCTRLPLKGKLIALLRFVYICLRLHQPLVSSLDIPRLVGLFDLAFHTQLIQSAIRANDCYGVVLQVGAKCYDLSCREVQVSTRCFNQHSLESYESAD